MTKVIYINTLVEAITVRFVGLSLKFDILFIFLPQFLIFPDVFLVNKGYGVWTIFSVGFEKLVFWIGSLLVLLIGRKYPNFLIKLAYFLFEFFLQRLNKLVIYLINLIDKSVNFLIGKFIAKLQFCVGRWSEGVYRQSTDC